MRLRLSGCCTVYPTPCSIADIRLRKTDAFIAALYTTQTIHEASPTLSLEICYICLRLMQGLCPLRLMRLMVAFMLSVGKGYEKPMHL